MLLYIHVPFCRSKCRYCAFVSRPLDMAEVEVYAAALPLEIRHFGKKLGRPKVETVYFGGGTPSLLPPWALSRLMPEINKHFDLHPAVEWTFEANPDSALDVEYLKILASYGVNRISLGVQSFSDAALTRLGRPHNAKTAMAAVNAVRQAGFVNLSLDFIWGLPNQREGAWLEDLKMAVRLRPEHLSCYGLTLEPGTPLAADAEAGGLELPTESEQGRMYIHGAEFLEEQGYLQYEISSFARMGFQSRHNSGYWEGRDYLGLGPGAVSTLSGVRHENPRDVREWAALAKTGRCGAGGVALTREERVREYVMLSLRTAKGLRLSIYRRLTGIDFLKENESLLTALRQKELIRLNNGHLRLTKNGFLVSNLILERLRY
ncbi:radical SAM family heme chaperone HemW [Desulfovibrio aerotolerans]|uniref:Heme chaperone HemW n=1 Tax=Solidesulfovibrio aerotolerans TaxID=295255 RepID=A0A7C9MKL5_9BACT|nr:radical SAM family heme chaperone HemW [Solidesulfovibrio aerotolerans]MYL83033.1 radical SAM family heme chaperone HemW [Solidesulfovibrio aerotolerans]